MRKFLVTALVAGGMAGSTFLAGAHAATAPTYSSPCGSSAETGPAPTQPGPSTGATGIIGPNGYLEAVGNPGPPPSGHVSGTTAGAPVNVYGSAGNDGSNGGHTVCFGTSQTGPLVKQ